MKRTVGVVLSCAFLSFAACSSVDQGGEELPPTVESPGSQQQAASGSQPVWHSVWSGGSATAYAADAFSSTSMYAYENKSSKARYTYFNLYSNSVDPSSLTCVTQTVCWDPTDPASCWDEQWCNYSRYTWTYAWGELPASDFQVSPNGAALSTDLADATNAWGEKCSVDYVAGTWDCQPFVAAGTIDVVWRANNLYSSFQNGINQSSYGKYTSKNVGQYRSSSADVHGTIFGASAQMQGDFSQSQGVSVSRDVIKTP